MRTYRSPSETLNARSIIDTNGCRVWTGCSDTHGYGQIRVNYKAYLTHRLAWELTNGPIPEGKYIDHMCHNPGCSTVDHLRLASPKQNQEHRIRANSTSVSGVRGVQWRPEYEDYRAYVIHERKKIHVGLYKNLADAEAAVIAKRLELFTHNDQDRLSA